MAIASLPTRPASPSTPGSFSFLISPPATADIAVWLFSESVDPDEVASPWLYSWDCSDQTTPFKPVDCPDPILAQLYVNTPKLVYPATALTPGVFLFTLTVTKEPGPRKDVTSAKIEIVADAVPQLTIAKLSLAKINPADRLQLTASSATSGEKTTNNIWTVVSGDVIPGKFVTLSLSDSRFLLLKENSLIAGSKYVFSFSANVDSQTGPNPKKGVTQIEVQVNQPPSGGSCSAAPTAGPTLTPVKFQCDPLFIDDKDDYPLFYRWDRVGGFSWPSKAAIPSSDLQLFAQSLASSDSTKYEALSQVIFFVFSLVSVPPTFPTAINSRIDMPALGKCRRDGQAGDTGGDQCQRSGAAETLLLRQVRSERVCARPGPGVSGNRRCLLLSCSPPKEVFLLTPSPIPQSQHGPCSSQGEGDAAGTMQTVAALSKSAAATKAKTLARRKLLGIDGPEIRAISTDVRKKNQIAAFEDHLNNVLFFFVLLYSSRRRWSIHWLWQPPSPLSTTNSVSLFFAWNLCPFESLFLVGCRCASTGCNGHPCVNDGLGCGQQFLVNLDCGSQSRQESDLLYQREHRCGGPRRHQYCCQGADRHSGGPAERHCLPRGPCWAFGVAFSFSLRLFLIVRRARQPAMSRLPCP